MNERPRLDLDADCACGAVRVHAAGPVDAMLLCACRDCQKATGSGHAAVLTLMAACFRVEGETRGFSRPADSGAIFTRHFCPTCATTVFATSSRAPDWVLVPAGLFAGHNDWFRPNQLIFARSQAPWDTIAADLPRHRTYRLARSGQ